MSKRILKNPTKKTLIEFLKQSNIPDDARLNVSLGKEDIYTAVKVEISNCPDGEGKEFLLDFDVK